MKLKPLIITIAIGSVLFCFFSYPLQNRFGNLRAGDILFIQNPSGQGKAIQLATKSKYTHVGIILPDKNGRLVVYHAVEPVRMNSIAEFISMSSDGKFETMRLKDSLLINSASVEALKNEAAKLLGKHYDIYFAWNDEEMYCSEFVWKVFKRAVNIEPGPLKPLGSFDLTSPPVKQKLKERYGDNVPLNENMISPGDMHDWPGLMRVD